MRKSLVLCLLLLAGCQNAAPPKDRPTASNIPVVSAVPATVPRRTLPEPTCYGASYAEKKTGFDGRSSIFGRTAENIPTSQPIPRAPAERIILQTNRLQTPPEIAAIERGFTHHWVGGFINDGLVTWSGIDLDRRLSINIQRRVWDARAQLSRRFLDPVFTEYDRNSFARKWSSEARVETEVVQIRDLDQNDITVFVCVANGAWAFRLPDPRMHFRTMSDTLVNDMILYDRQFENGEGVLYRKTMNLAPPKFSMNSTSFPAYKWDMEPQGAGRPQN